MAAKKIYVACADCEAVLESGEIHKCGDTGLAYYVQIGEAPPDTPTADAQVGGPGQKFRLFSPTQGETPGDARVFYQTQLPATLEGLTDQALAYLARCWTADTVTSPLQYQVVMEDGATLITKILLKSDSRWPW